MARNLAQSPSPQRSPVRASLAPVTDVQAVAADWRALEATATCSFFTSWGWIGPWAEQALSRAKLQLFRAVRDGRTVGLAFLTPRRVARRNGLIRVTQLQMNEHNVLGADMIIEHNGILCADEDLAACWQALASATAASSVQWDELAFRALSAPQAAAARTALAGLREEVDRELATWVVPLAPQHATAESLLGVFKKKTRQQMRQSLREFESMGPLALRIAGTQEEAAAFFAEMESLHNARWHRVGKAGSFANRPWKEFHDQVIRGGVARGDVLIARATCGDDVIGFVYGYIWRGRFYALQTGFKPFDRAALRAGYVTHFLFMQALAARDVAMYDFLPAEESSYKRLLAEPEQVLSTTRFQRARLIFVIERIALALRSALAKRRRPAVEPPSENPAT